MARLCLTRKNGTSWQGLYRGLKLKTRGTPWDVEVVGGSPDRLISLADGPMILMVGLGRLAGRDPDLRREQGWIPGVCHAVLLCRFDECGVVEVLDPAPSIGHDTWTIQDFRTLWKGCAIRLVRRSLSHD